MSDNELLLAMAELFDKKMETQLQALRDDIRDIKLTLENNITPNIQLLAENYVPAAKRYEKGSTEIENLKVDIELIKKVIKEHSDKLNRIA
ncbi:hypothetical protein GPL02_08185 [Clostridium sp. MCC334]|jgi:hypothetical protein|nr:hypothetical protein [Clostridium sp. MCC334]